MTDKIWAFIVEDNPHDLLTITNLFRELGFTIKRNTTGQDVLDKLRLMHPKPAILMLDMDLPAGDPFEIVQTLKTDPELAPIPVVAMSRDPKPHEVKAAQRRGFSGFVSKPLPRKQFPELVEKVISGQKVCYFPPDFPSPSDSSPDE